MTYRTIATIPKRLDCSGMLFLWAIYDCEYLGVVIFCFLVFRVVACCPFKDRVSHNNKVMSNRIFINNYFNRFWGKYH